MVDRVERFTGPDWIFDIQGAVRVPEIQDSRGNEVVEFASVESAVNNVKLTNAVTGGSALLGVDGGDTNISLRLQDKGTAMVVSDAPFLRRTTVTTDTTAGALTYTAAMLLGGLILRDPNGAGRSDVTPTATLLLAALPGCVAGDSFDFVIRNTADAAETITVTAGTGATLSGTMTIAQNNSKLFVVVIDNVASPAYTVYSVGTFVH